jgi:hypothetical protein
MTIKTTRRIARGFSRRTLLGRAAAGAAAAIGYLWIGPSRSLATSGPALRGVLDGCNFNPDLSNKASASAECRQLWGGPSEDVSGPRTVYSPSEIYWHTAYAYCPVGPGRCTPRLFQVWVLVCNDGECNHGWRSAS